MRVCIGLVLLAVSLTPGCSCSERGNLAAERDAAAADAGRDGAPPDGQRDGPARFDGGRRDGGLPLDGGTCNYEGVWHLEPRALSAVRFANGAPPRVGVTEQLLVEVPLFSGSCEDLARVDVTINSGNATDFVGLTAQVWRLEGDLGCTADAPLASTVVTVPGRAQGNLNVVVADTLNPGGGVRLTYQRDACSGMPDCQCWGGSPPGPVPEHGACRTDCSCAAGLSCIGYWGVAAPLWTCERPCVDSRDCRPGSFCATQVADGPSSVCFTGDQCESDGDCPPGFTCATDASGWSYCHDWREGPTWEPCQCDAECTLGNQCTWDEDLADCLTPCRKDSDCPTADGIQLYVCGFGAVCVPLE